MSHQETAKKMRFGEKIGVDDISKEVDLPPKYLSLIQKIAQDYAYLSIEQGLQLRPYKNAHSKKSAPLTQASFKAR